VDNIPVMHILESGKKLLCKNLDLILAVSGCVCFRIWSGISDWRQQRIKQALVSTEVNWT
jgi:hypothetical protein